MTDTPLIKRVVTADRGNARTVTTSEVLACIYGLQDDRFSSRDVADALRSEHQATEYLHLEYAVRRSIAWLVKRGDVVVTKDTVKRYTRFNEPYWATVYERVEHMGPCDVCLLNSIFMGMEKCDAEILDVLQFGDTTAKCADN